ncbi:MAG: aconitate hydratase AcnA [Bacteriovoracaceae bacterium]
MDTSKNLNSFGAASELKVGNKTYTYYSLKAKGLGDTQRLPFSLKVILENLLRHENGTTVSKEDIDFVAALGTKKMSGEKEIAYHPARVLMQDFTGVPAVVDLAAMREAMKNMGGDPQKINPLVPVDLVIDHSVMVDKYGEITSFKENVDLEYDRNFERYAFLRWGQKAFNNFRVVPPGTGICHQVNVEYLAQTVWVNDKNVAYPDTCVGTDSHTTMVNGLAVLGWGVGGIEAEAAMLGQPVSMLVPEVIGFKLTGKMKEGTTATDIVLTVTQMLRKKGVVGKFVEFYGSGLNHLTLADRSTIANMAPEYGATCGFFPIDQETVNYLAFTGRDAERVALVEAYAKAQGMWREPNSEDPIFADSLELDISTVGSTMAGPKRPQDKVVLADAKENYNKFLNEAVKEGLDKKVPVAGADFHMQHGHVVIAAITSCTNTSNPSVLVGAGLLARKAAEKGLTTKPWVKTSLAPGSQVVTEYLAKAGLDKDLDKLGFNLVGYGCTTCIGNSGPLKDNITKAVEEGKLNVGAVISGNRNFEGRVHPLVQANYLASPMLVVAYALAGSLHVDITKDAIGFDKFGKPVFLKDIWPSNEEIASTINQCLTSEMFKSRYASVFLGDKAWQAIPVKEGATYAWNEKSTYVKNPPYFVNMKKVPDAPKDIANAKILGLFGDSITTDHISPAGNIKKDSPAGQYLLANGVQAVDFNSYGARRGNHEAMMRGTFANIRLKNEMMGGIEGGITKYLPTGETMSIYDASMKYIDSKTDLVVIAGKEYGTGSSRDWAGKGTMLLGIKAVIAESFERIHRSNLIGMGVVPMQFVNGMSRTTLGLTGEETFTINGISSGLKPKCELSVDMTKKDGSKQTFKVLCRIDTLDELNYFMDGGILHYVLRNLNK